MARRKDVRHLAVRRKDLLWTPLGDRDDGRAGSQRHARGTRLPDHGPQSGVTRDSSLGIDADTLPAFDGVDGCAERQRGVLRGAKHRNLTGTTKQSSEQRDIEQRRLRKETRSAPRVVHKVRERQGIRVRDVVGAHDHAATARNVVRSLPIPLCQRGQGRLQDDDRKTHPGTDVLRWHEPPSRSVPAETQGVESRRHIPSCRAGDDRIACVDATPTVQWTLVVPVKRLAQAKTRLVELPRLGRAELALAFAADTVDAALHCPPWTVLWSSPTNLQHRDSLRALGADVVADAPDAGLNPALVHGAVEAKRRHPDTGVGALSADLPALRPGRASACPASCANRCPPPSWPMSPASEQPCLWPRIAGRRSRRTSVPAVERRIERPAYRRSKSDDLMSRSKGRGHPGRLVGRRTARPGATNAAGTRGSRALACRSCTRQYGPSHREPDRERCCSTTESSCRSTPRRSMPAGSAAAGGSAGAASVSAPLERGSDREMLRRPGSCS